MGVAEDVLDACFLDHGGGDGPLTLRAGKYNTALSVLPVDDFPSMTEGKLPTRFSASSPSA